MATKKSTSKDNNGLRLSDEDMNYLVLANKEEELRRAKEGSSVLEINNLQLQMKLLNEKLSDINNKRNEMLERHRAERTKHKEYINSLIDKYGLDKEKVEKNGIIYNPETGEMISEE